MEKIEYTSLNLYLRNIFGCKVYKVALDGGFTCPNRDGTLGNNGCIFCSKGGSGEFTFGRNLSVTEQLREGKCLIKDKLPNEEVKYIAYFQAFTNTYAPVDELKEKYLEAITDPEVCVLSVATRPDCLEPQIISLLKEINSVKPVWVELGFQTSKEETADYIRRGYKNEVYDEAVRKLSEAGIEVITHVIIGLPGETREDMLDTVKYVVNSGVKGIKLQLLHVLEGTDLATEYKAGKFDTLSMDEYISIICDCLRLLPRDMVVHRLTGDGDKRQLIAPLWSTDKKKVLNTLNKKILQKLP